MSTSTNNSAKKKKRKFSSSHSDPNLSFHEEIVTVTQEDTNRPPSDANPPAIPPIIIHLPDEYTKHSKDLKALGHSFTAQVKGRRIRLSCKDSDGYRSISKYLQTKNIEFHSFSLKNDSPKIIKVVIRGLLIDSNTDEIKEELVAQGYTVHKVVQMMRTVDSEKQYMPLFVVILENSSADIYKVNSLLHLSVSVEGLKRDQNRINQCFRCQRFGHSSLYCFAMPRCVKCSKSHAHKECQKQPDEQPYCVNCESFGHPANFKGCAYYKKLLTSRTPASAYIEHHSPPINAPRFNHANPSSSRSSAPPPTAQTPRPFRLITPKVGNRAKNRNKLQWPAMPKPTTVVPNSSAVFEATNRLLQEKSNKTAENPVEENLRLATQQIKTDMHELITYIKVTINKLQEILAILCGSPSL